MANTNRISVELDLNLKHAEQQVSEFKEMGIKVGLNEKDLNKVSALEQEIKELNRAYENLGRTKLNTKQFTDTTKHIQDSIDGINKTIATLQDNFTKIVSALSNTDKANLEKTFGGVVDNIKDVNNAITNTVTAIKSASQTFDDVEIVNSQDKKNLESILKLYKELEQSTKDIGSVSIKRKGKETDLSYAKRLKESITELYLEYEKLDLEVAEFEGDKSSKQFIDLQKQLSQKIISLRETINAFDELSNESLRKQGFGLGITKINIDEDSYDLKELRDGLLNQLYSIEESAEKEVNRINEVLRQLSNTKETANVVDTQRSSKGIAVPLYVSTGQEAFRKQVEAVLSVTQEAIAKKPITVGFKLVSNYKTNRYQELLEQMQKGIGQLDDSEIKEKYKTLIADLETQFSNGATITVKSDVKNAEIEIRKAIKNLQSALNSRENKFHISPDVEIPENKIKKIQTELNRLTKELTLNINKIEVSDKAIKEVVTKTGKKANLIDAKSIADTTALAALIDKIVKSNKEFLSSDKAIAKSLLDIKKVVETIPVNEIINPVKELVSLMQNLMGIMSKDELDKMFDGLKVDVNEITGALKGTNLQQIKDVLEGFKQYQLAGGDKDISELGGAKNVQKWLQKNNKNVESQNKTRSLGNDFATEYGNGITEKIPDVQNAATEMTNAALEAVRSTQDSHSPAKETEKLGNDFAAGYVKGIKNYSKDSNLDLLSMLIGEFNNSSILENTKDLRSLFDILQIAIDNNNVSLKELLDNLGYLNKNGVLSSITGGNLKQGGLIGEDTVLLLSKNGSERLEEIKKLNELLQQGEVDGVQYAKVLRTILDEKNNLLIEEQEIAPGKQVGTYGVNGNTPSVNTDVLKATDEQVLKLISDLYQLQKAGIGVDLSLENLFYDQKKGFTLIDLDANGVFNTDYSSFKEFFEDTKTILIGDIKAFYEDIQDEEGLKKVDLFSENFDKLGEQFSKIVDVAKQTTAEAQDSHSPSRVAEKLGEYWGEGYAQGILNTTAKVKNAIRALVEAGELTIKDLDEDGSIASEKAFNEFIEGRNLTKESEKYLRQIKKRQEEDFYTKADHNIVDSIYSSDNNILGINTKEYEKNTKAKKDNIKISKEELEIQEELNRLEHEQIDSISQQDNSALGINESDISLGNDNIIESQDKIQSELQETNSELNKQEKKWKEYSNGVAVGADRIRKMEIISESGTVGDNSVYELLRLNHPIWDEVKANHFFNDIPEEGLQRYKKILEVVERICKEMLDASGLTEEQFVSQLKEINSAKGGSFRINGQDAGWTHFATYTDDKKDKMPSKNDLTYKVYASFDDIKDLNKDVISSLMEELTKAGFKGRLKTTSGSTSFGDKINGLGITDQLVVHGASKKDQEIAYNTIKNLLGQKLSYLGGGIDTKDGSFSQTLASGNIEKYIKQVKEATNAEKELIQTQKQSNETPVSSDKVIDDVKKASSEQVVESTKESTVAIEKEEQAFDKVSESAQKAANAKNEFADANKKAKKSAKETATAISNEGSKSSSTYNEEIALLKERNKLEQEVAKNTDDSIGNAPKIERIAELDSKINSLREERIKLGQEDANQQAKVDSILSEQEFKLKSINAQLMQKQVDSYSNNANGWINQLEKIINSNKYTDAYKNNVEDTINEIKSFSGSLAKTDGSDIDFLKNKYDELNAKVKQTIEVEKQLNDNRVATEQTILKIGDRIEKFGNQNTAMGSKFKKEFKELQEAWSNLRFDNSDKSIADITSLSNKFLDLERRINATGKTGDSFFVGLGKRIKSMSQSALGMYFSLYDIIRYTREAFNTIRELDTDLVDLRKTTSMTNTELEEFYNDASDIAKQMGVTTSAIIEQASAWSRLGYSSKEASETMAVLSSQFASISPGMSTEEAQEGLVSTMKAFGINVEDTERTIMDNINKIGNTMALTNKDVIDMLERSSAAMNAANNTLEETIALESAAMEITQNAEMTGTAFKTISMRIRGYDEETEELSEDLENISGDIADLTKTASTPGGISLFTDSTKETYKSTYQLLKDISEIWDQLTDKQQAGLLEKLGGKRGGQAIAGMLKDFSQVDKALMTMEGAAGSADSEMEIIYDSIDYKLNALKQEWVGTLQTLANKESIKNILDVLLKISEVLGAIIDKTGLLGTSIIAFGTGFAIKKWLDGKDIFAVKDLADNVALLTDKLVGETATNKANTNSILENIRARVALIKQQKEEIANDTVSATTNETEALTEKQQAIADEEHGAAMIFANKQQEKEIALDGVNTITNGTEGGTESLGIFGDIKKGVDKFVKYIKASFNAIYGIIGAAGMAIAGIITIIAGSFATVAVVQKIKEKQYENAKNEFEKLKSETQSGITELDGLNNQLDDVDAKISQIRSKGSLSLTDKQDLENLKLERKNLELMIEAQERYNEQKARETADSGFDTFEKDFKNNDKILSTDVTLEGYQNQKELTEKKLKKATDSSEIEKLKNKIEELDSKIQTEEAEIYDKISEYNEIKHAYEGADEAYQKAHKEEYDEVINAIKREYERVDPAAWNEMQISSVVDDLDITDEKLSELAETSGSTSYSVEGLTEALNNANLITKDGQKPLDVFNQYLLDYKKNAEEAADASKTFSDSIKGIISTANQTDPLASIYEDVQNGEDFSYDSLLNDDFVSTFSEYTEQYENFIETITNSPNDIAKCQQAFNDLAGAWLYGSGVLDNLNDNNAEATKLLLKQKGFVDADAIVERQLAAANEYLAATGYELKDATLEQVNAFMRESDASEQAKKAIALYTIQKTLANKENLTTQGSIRNLMALLKSIGVTVSGLGKYAQAMSAANQMASGNGLGSNEARGEMIYRKNNLNASSGSFSQIASEIYKLAGDMGYGNSVNYNPSTNKTSSSGGGGGGKDDTPSPEVFDWVEVKLNRIQEKVDKLKATAETTWDSWGGKNGRDKALKKEIDALKKLENQAKKGANKYLERANSLGLSSDLTDLIKNGKLRIDDITDEALKEKLHDYQTWYEKYLDALNKADEARTAKIQAYLQQWENLQTKYQQKVEKIQKNREIAQTKWDAKQNINRISVDAINKNYKSEKKSLNSELKESQSQTKKLQNKLNDLKNKGIKKNSEEWNKLNLEILESKNNTAKLEAELKKLNIQNIVDQFEKIKSDLDWAISKRQNKIDVMQKAGELAQAQGHTLTAKYYKYDTYQRQKENKDYNSSISKLQGKITAGLRKDKNFYNSDEYRDLVKQIKELQLNIIDNNIAIENNSTAIRQLKWDRFDRYMTIIDDKMDQFADFANIFENEFPKLTNNENGRLNDAGKNALSLTLSQRSYNLAKKDLIEKEIASVTKDLKKDPTDQVLQDRLRTLKSNLRDIADTEMQLASKVKSYLETQYNAMLEVMQKTIDKRKEELQSEKDLYDYRKNVENQTKNIAKLRKQLMAYEGDDSSENKARIQKLQVELNNAEEELKETEWERQIQEEEKLMDNLYQEFDDLLQEILNQPLHDILTAIQEGVYIKGIDYQSVEEATKDLVGNGKTDENGQYIDSSSLLGQNKTDDDTLANIAKLISAQNDNQETKNKNEYSNNLMKLWTKAKDTYQSYRKSYGKDLKGKSGTSDGSWISETKFTTLYNQLKDFLNTAGIKFTAPKAKGKDTKANRVKALRKMAELAFSTKSGYQVASWMKNGFAKGGTIGKAIKSTGEDGFILARTGEEVLSLDKIKGMTDVLEGFKPLATALPTLNAGTNIGSTNIGDIAFTINLPNVTNYSEFKNELQNDKNFQKWTQEITIGRTLGNNSLIARKY